MDRMPVVTFISLHSVADRLWRPFPLLLQVTHRAKSSFMKFRLFPLLDTNLLLWDPVIQSLPSGWGTGDSCWPEPTAGTQWAFCSYPPSKFDLPKCFAFKALEISRSMPTGQNNRRDGETGNSSSECTLCPPSLPTLLFKIPRTEPQIVLWWWEQQPAILCALMGCLWVFLDRLPLKWCCRWLWSRLPDCCLSSCLQLAALIECHTYTFHIQLPVFIFPWLFWSLHSYQKGPAPSLCGNRWHLWLTATNSSPCLPQTSSEGQKPLDQVYHNNAPLLVPASCSGHISHHCGQVPNWNQLQGENGYIGS